MSLSTSLFNSYVHLHSHHFTNRATVFLEIPFSSFNSHTMEIKKQILQTCLGCESINLNTDIEITQQEDFKISFHTIHKTMGTNGCSELLT